MTMRPHARQTRIPGPSDAPGRRDLEDALSSLSDRADLEGLYDRNVTMSHILRLAGKGIRREAVLTLMKTPDPALALRKLLRS